MVVKHNLRLLMAKNKVKSILELSRKTGINHVYLYNMDNGIHKKIDPEVTAKLCETFNCGIGDLYYLDKEVGKWYLEK